jgi:uncharacterized protein (DUF1501 family)
MTRIPSLSRRDWLKLSAAGVLGASMSGWLEALAAGAAKDPQRKRACILLWMSGGPSQMDTFDLKPGQANGGPYKAIDTNVPGIKISEHLPKLAKHADKLAIVRSMSTKEADHGRATYQMRTGRVPGGPVQYPSLGAVVAKEREDPEAELPRFVSIAPNRGVNQEAYGAGFLGPQYAPLIVGEGAGPGARQGQGPNIDQILKVQDIDLPAGVSGQRAAGRVGLLEEMDQEFLGQHAATPSLSHRAARERALKMMRSSASKAFSLEDEPAKLRDAYGQTVFGQGCLLARRLVERGVPFVEVSLPGWDTHLNNFDGVQRLSGVLDPAWAALMDDLKDKGLLDSTLVVWMGEFGRTPRINGNKGRDHWAVSWSTVIGGGGIKGGQVVGKSSADGTSVEERPVSVPDLLSTVCLALGLDITKQNNSNVGRPIRLVEPGAKPIKEVLA